MTKLTLIGLALMTSLALPGLTGCSAAAAGDDDEIGDESAALTARLAPGSAAVTIARLRFRDEPSTSANILKVLPQGTRVTLVDGEPENGFYQVKLASGETGYCHGNYLQAAGGGSQPVDPGNGNNGGGVAGTFPTSGDIFTSRGTGYYPDDSPMEGGFVDRRGARLRTLQGYLSGRDEYVSVAMDTSAFSYGQKLRIKQLEQKYGRPIEFRVVDTGGAFRGRGRSRIDICVQNASASVDPTINGSLTIAVVR